MGVAIAGIAGMGVATDTRIALKPGDSTRLAGYEWRLEGISDAQGANFTARRATLTVSRDGAVVTVPFTVVQP
jgi:cytochrome c-type biogenesis protein CcmF